MAVSATSAKVATKCFLIRAPYCRNCSGALSSARPRGVEIRSSCAAAETVAEPAHALDQARLRGVRLDLLSQIQNVRIDDAIAHVGPMLPGGLDQLLPAQHAAPALDERLEQPELEGRQLHGRAIFAYGRPIEIHFEVVEPADAGRLMFEPAQHRADARAKFARAERLGHVIIGAEFQPRTFSASCALAVSRMTGVWMRDFRNSRHT